MFSDRAEQDGTVTAITENTITVTYKDGTIKGFELGNRYAAAAGLTIPQPIATDFKVGNKFKAGDVITYNTNYFTKDRYSDTLSFKNSTPVNVVVYENEMTDEDACTVSADLASKLSTNTTKVRDIVVNFEQQITNLVKVGTEVEANDVLCQITDDFVAQNNTFTKEDLDTLKLLGSQVPLAKVRGRVSKIEVFYHGDLEDMSDGLRKLAREHDRILANKLKSLGKNVYTGSVDEGYRVDGEPLMLDTLVVRVYIDSEIASSVGDKLVFGLQLKSIISKVNETPLTTEDGRVLDVEFGRRAIYARIVNSPDIIGTTTVLLEVIAKKALEAYNK